jgi:hypothetical protein
MRALVQMSQFDDRRVEKRPDSLWAELARNMHFINRV